MMRKAIKADSRNPFETIFFNGAFDVPLTEEAAGDLQRIDLGIALCHFALAAEESDINICFSISDPGSTADADTEYIASYLLPQ